MAKQVIDVKINDEGNKIEVFLDPDTFAAFKSLAEKKGISVDDLAKRVIEDGIMREIRGGMNL